MKRGSRSFAVATALAAQFSACSCSGGDRNGATVAQSGSTAANSTTCNDVTVAALNIPHADCHFRHIDASQQHDRYPT